jgi:mono/diheme cytochrome c family protein
MIKSVVIGLSIAGAFALGHPAQAADKPTFTKDVLPILQENCQVCHRPDGANLGGMIAPMALTTYEETRPWAKSIAKNVAQRTMPPWHAAPAHHGEFANERTLTQDEIDTIVAWVNSGTLRGNRADAPEPLKWDSSAEWSIGEPDLILTMPENYFVNDDVEDIYVNFNTEITTEMIPEDRFIKAVEFRPGSSVVHHIIARPLGGIAPGNDPTVYPDGIGQKFGPGMSVDWQMHYHKEPGPGTGSYDQSRIALKFYEDNSMVKYELKGAPLGRFDFQIPAGDSNYSISSSQTFEYDTQLVNFTPHMHLRGKAAKYEAFYPDGTSEVLLDVPAYDFNWQTSYGYKEFKKIPKGTKIVFTSWWDNSAENEFNPDPTKTIGWGQPTTDEMSFGFMSYIDDSGESRPMFGGGRRGGGEGRRRGFDLAAMIERLDTDGDGMLQKSEAPERLRGFFAVIDSNGDGGIDKAEAEAAMRQLGGGS